MTEIGAPMLPSGITNIEKERRTVTAENLLCLAAALNASPADLLGAPDSDSIAIAPGLDTVTPFALRTWLAASMPLPITKGADYDDARAAMLDAAPDWFRKSAEREQQTFRHPAIAALTQLTTYAKGAILEEDGIEPQLLATTIRESLGEVVAYVNLLADALERRANDAER